MKVILFFLLFVPALICGIIGMFGSFISAPIFIWFNPNYNLPHDKAWIDVVPVTSHCWRFYAWYIDTFVIKLLDLSN